MLSEKDHLPINPRILIVDDETHCVETLRAMLQRKYPSFTQVNGATSVATAREMIGRYTPELVFLDVEMPHQNGFDLLKSLECVSFDVIFTTAYEHYAIKAIKFNALDYLLKPFSMKELDAAVQKYIRKRDAVSPTDYAIETFLSNLKQPASLPKKITLPTLRGLIFTPVEQIIRCEAKDNYSKVYLTDGTAHLVSKTLKEFEYLLEDMNFFRVHYSHLINLQHICKYVQGNGGHVLMSDGSSIEVSRRRKPEFLRRSSQL